MAAALERSLAKTPADRFNPVAQFGEAISPRTSVAGSPTSVPVSAEPRSIPAAARRGRRVTIGLAAVAVLVVALGTAVLVPRFRGPALDPNRVLVVAFADDSGPEGTRAFGRMTQDYIIQHLSETGVAEVVDPLTALAVSQNVAAGTADGHEDIQALANDAGAGTVVSGTYYAEGDSLHVQTRITDARDGRLLRTVGPVVGAVDARRDLVARLGQEVAAALAPLLDRDVASWETAMSQPPIYEAYGAYAEGLELYLRGEYAAGARHFERAAEADPTFHRATLWAAQGYAVMGADYARAESLIAPLIASREQLGRFERCRLDFVMALAPRRSLSAAYDAARCMAREGPGSDDAKREVALFTYRLNRPREAIDRARENARRADETLRRALRGVEEAEGMLQEAARRLGRLEPSMPSVTPRAVVRPDAVLLEAFRRVALRV